MLAVSVSLIGSGSTVALASGAHGHVEVFIDGHLDVFGVVLEDTDPLNPELELVILEELAGGGGGGGHAHGAELHPDDAVLGLKVPEGEVTIPSNPAFSFLGTAGETVYVFPQVENPNMLWPGLGAEELIAADWTGNMSLVLNSITGPGDVFLYTVDSFGVPTVYWDSTDLTPSSFPFLAGAHVHFNLAFTEPGTYQVPVQVSGTHNTHGALTSAVAPYTFHVGPIAELEVDKNVDDTTPQTTTNVTFTVTATNEGPNDATGVSVADSLPTGLTFVSSNPSLGTYDSGTGVWTIGSLTSGSFATLEIVATVNAGTETTTISNTATISNSTAGELDPTDENNSADASIVPWADVDPGAGDASQDIQAQIVDGGLSISVAAGTVDLGVLSLNSDNTLLTASGALNAVEVLDLRLSDPGWSVNGQVGTFTATTGSFSSSALGWTPSVDYSSPDQTVAAGAAVAPAPGNPGLGLSSSSTLGSAGAGDGRGTAVLEANLELEVPTSTSPGDYEATLTLTVI